MESAVILALGMGLLLFGRKLFWFFVGALGFLGGWYLATHYAGGEQPQLVLIIAAAAGLLGLVLAVFVKKVAILVGGFLAGGISLMTIAGMWSVTAGLHAAIPFLVGGLIGTLLARMMFEWGLILLSSFAGAATITQTLHLADPARTPLLVLLLVVGIVVQWRMKRGPSRDENASRRRSPGPLG
jgi:hypothetical protein